MSLIPKSRAKTAYERLDEIKKLILEEPLRYCQEEWKITPETVNLFDYGITKFPACNTVACVAGWETILATPEWHPVDSLLDYGIKATADLGLTTAQADELFYGEALWNVVEPLEIMPPLQTKAYAKLGAKHISAFQKKYAKQLKAFKLKEQ